MPSEWLTRRAFAQSVASALVSASMWPATAHASLFGEENASLLAILAELIEQVMQAAQTVEGVFQTVDQVKSVVTQGRTMLSRLENIGDIRGLLDFLLDAVGTLRAIDGGVKKLGYKINAIDQQHRTVFPTREAMESTPSKGFTGMAQGWNDAMRESILVAMRAQTSIESLQERAKAQQKILDASRSAEGVVGQLQAVVAGLSLLHSDVNALELNLASGMRVLAAWAGKQAAREDLIAEDHKRMMEGYASEDAPGAVLTELP